MSDLTETIKSSFYSLPEQIFAFLAPFVLPVIVVSIIWHIIKFFVNGSVYNCAILTGDSKRQARKKSKKSEAAIDLISTFNDLNNLGKK